MDLLARVNLIAQSTGMWLAQICRNEALQRIEDGQAVYLNRRTILLVPGARASGVETRCNLRNPHAPKPKRVDSSHGDAGLTRTHGFRTLHIGLGQSEAGL